MYQALYRKYRSQTFEEMVGQEVISTTLKQAVENKKISHAYLFSGPRGTGKTSAAKIFAKAMNCPNQQNGEPCNNCDLCQAITNGSLEDVIEIDAASNNGVDEIRDIRDKSTYAPSRATYKVYIIDEVHMLSTGAFNALLKTLEEPTENVVFILATTELHKIPATILSRVQRFEFKSIKLQDIIQHLASILDKEGVEYDQTAIEIIARRAEGGMRDALSILDQALSLSQTNRITTEVAEEITGSISLAALDAYVAHIREEDATAALTDLEMIFDNGKSMSRFVTDLLNYLRDLIVAHAGGLVTQSSEAFQANLALPQEALFQMIEEVTQALPEIKNGTHPKIYAEMLTIRLAQEQKVGHQANQSEAIPENVTQELNALRQEVARLKQDLLALSDGKPVKKTTKAPVRTQNGSYKVDKDKIMTIMNETVEKAEQSRHYLESLKGAWNEILDSISPQDRALLQGSEPVLANGENAILAFKYSFNAEQTMLRTNLNDTFSNIMSSVAGFAPNILAVPDKDWQAIRQEYKEKRMASQPNTGQEEETTQPDVADQIPESFGFLSEVMEVKPD